MFCYALLTTTACHRSELFLLFLRLLLLFHQPKSFPVILVRQTFLNVGINNFEITFLSSTLSVFLQCHLLLN
ncbi:unnamed protein product [Rhizophagus irregularis]|nr:unnamed protein product [Rhizophagus irregularis]